MWRAIDGYEDLYEINEKGLIRRINNQNSRGKRKNSCIVLSSLAQNGSRYIALWKEGSRRTFMLHKLYARAFDVSENEAARRLYKGFYGTDGAALNVKKLLLSDRRKMETEQEKGFDRHDEILYLDSIMTALDQDQL